MNKFLRHFDDSSPITMCFNYETSPLIRIKENGEIAYFNQTAHKLNAIMNMEKTDKFIIAWSGKWRTDVFEVTQDDIDLIKVKY